MEASKNKKKDEKESLLIVRPAIKSLGLDYLHITLIVLVVVLVAFGFGLSQFKQGVLVSNCTYGQNANQTCITPMHNSTQALQASERILASYGTINTTLSLLAYYSYVNKAQVSYLTGKNEWLVVFPYEDPLNNNSTQYFSLLLYDSNLTLAQPFLETIPPTAYSNDQVVSKGVISISGKVACQASGPLQVFAFIDPYAPGAIAGIYSGLNASSEFGSRINMSYKFVFTGYAASHYAGFGINQTQAMGQDLWCASLQPSKFKAFLSNFSVLYTGSPISGSTLYSIATGSGLNMSSFGACAVQSSSVLDAQALLAKLYGVVGTPTYVVNCQYEAISPTLGSAINYALNETTSS